MSPREPFVFKHTSHDDYYGGSYEICMECLDTNTNPQTFAELTISDRYDPSLYYNTDDPIPLVESSELIQLNELVMVIKKGLSWCQTYVKEAQELGDYLEVQLENTTQTHKLAAYFQIAFLVLYGFVWVMLIGTLKR